MLLDPAYGKHSFAKLCGKAGFRAFGVVDILRRFMSDVALIRALTRLPEMMDGVVEDALPRLLPCSACSSGEVVGKICPECHGVGQVRIPGDIGKLKLIFAALGLTGRRGPLVVQQFIIAHRSDQTLEEFVHAAERLIASKSGDGPRSSGTREDCEHV